jgi:signal transduction histidine kinase
MNQHLQTIFEFIQQDERLSADEKNAVSKSLKEADKELEKIALKFDRTEKVKRTNAILLEETIEELEQKRKAVEAQNRELEIESSLERVRTIAMSMNKPDDMLDVCRIISEQLEQLGVREIRNVQTAIFYVSRGTYMNYEYYAKHKKTFITEAIYTNHEIAEAFAEKMLKGKGEVSITYIEGKKKVQEWLAYQKSTNVFIDTFLEEANSLNYYWHSLGPVALGISTYVPLKHDELKLFQRFIIVFELSFTRYLDIEQALSQAKEAQIELGLERVRARAMAMQNSDDLANAVAIIFEELDKLNMGMLRCGIGIISKETRSVNVWAATTSDKNIPVQISGDLSMDTHRLLQGAFNAWLKQEDYNYELQGEDLTAFYKAQASANFKLPDSQSLVTGNEGLRQYYFLATFQAGGLFAFRDTPFPEQAKKVMKRFAGVLNLTYKRFADIQKAEAQAREAQIELGLERVRARAMAMQKSEDVSFAIVTLFTELDRLGIENMRCGIANINKNRTMEVWSVTNVADGKTVEAVGTFDMNAHKLWQLCFDSWVNKSGVLHYYLSDNEKQDYIDILNNAPNYLSQSILEMPDMDFQSYQFNEGAIWTFSMKPHTEGHQQLMKRFTAVFSQTFRRYQDLQKAEAQAREAIKASSLDRIRAEIASMRTAEDLQRITPSIWKELTILGLPFFRCGIFIIHEKKEKIHAYLSTPDGKPLAVLDLDFTGSEVTRNVADYWSRQKVYTEHWSREQFNIWVQSLIGQGQIKAVNNYQTGDELPELLSLQFVPFIQGMLYVGSAVALSETQIELVKALADAFSVAYARYEDFTKLEEAKGQVEKTLTELKAAQAQLIQSEKMASLGELTAGIAHEIQNPLNFVNNFSEVSAEMIDEMKIEFEAGNKEEGAFLISEIKQNLEKIIHHGKRADAIVKGMLLHTRGSTGKKEPANINDLADEYLRLSYHGFRAKDKSFNVTMNTNFSENLPFLSIVPQDIGRVLLNLYNNAFYAVTEKKKKAIERYEPTVSVHTKRIGGGIEIHVMDDGNGIPEKILDKIFQPFFTTKPSGQGTGLGLSLSYDIIKAHGGELKVETREGEGAEFIIRLPV